MEEAEQRKHQRRIQRQNQSGLSRQRTNASVGSRKEPGFTEQEKDPHKPFNVWAKMRLRAQRPLGEWLGTTVYTFIGIGVNLAAVTSSNEAATMETQYWAWGFATMIGKSFLTGMLFVRSSRSRHLQLEVLDAYLSSNQESTSPAAPPAASSTPS